VVKESPVDIIDLSICTDESVTTDRKPAAKPSKAATSSRVAFDNGKQRTYEYEDIIEMINHDDENGVERWTYEKILDHRSSPEKGRKGKIDVPIKGEGYEDRTWEMGLSCYSSEMCRRQKSSCPRYVVY
jgi:hypothetical protein